MSARKFEPGDTALLVIPGEETVTVTVEHVSTHNAVVRLPSGKSGVVFLGNLSVDPWGPERLTYEDELTAFVYGASEGPYRPLSR